MLLRGALQRGPVRCSSLATVHARMRREKLSMTAGTHVQLGPVEQSEHGDVDVPGLRLAQTHASPQAAAHKCLTSQPRCGRARRRALTPSS